MSEPNLTKGIKLATVLTVLLLLGAVLFNVVYNTYRAAWEGDWAVGQLNADGESYAVKRVLSEGGIQKTVNVMICVALALVWLPTGWRLAKYVYQVNKEK